MDTVLISEILNEVPVDDLTIEKLRIVEQLQSIGVNQAVMSKQLDTLSADQRRLNDALMGDGSVAKIGLTIRLDRIEQAYQDEREKRSFHRKWIYGLLSASLLEHIRRFFFEK